MKFISRMFRKKQKVADSVIAPTPTLFVCDECDDKVPKAFRHRWNRSVLCEVCQEEFVSNQTDLHLSDLGLEAEYYGTEELVRESYDAEWTEIEIPKDYSNEPQVWGFVIEHPRTGYDRVYFGPFRTRDELSQWMQTVGRKHGVSGAVYPIMNPYGDPADFWWIPNDMPWDETLKPKKDRELVP